MYFDEWDKIVFMMMKGYDKMFLNLGVYIYKYFICIVGL